MKISPFASLLLSAIAVIESTTSVNAVAPPPPKGSELTLEYTFQEYLLDFDKVDKYNINGEEYQVRKQNFERNLQHVVEHNAKNRKGKGENSKDKEGGHTLGVNLFSDYSSEELNQLMGHDKSHRYKEVLLGAGTTTTTATATARHLRTTPTTSMKEKENSHELPLPFDITDIDTLPEQVDWTSYSTPIKNQGHCGSCWAFASTAALESHLAIHVYEDVTSHTNTQILSPQEMVSCVDNTNDCGGEGGCKGATAELAYDTIATIGMILESDFPYTGADTIQCPIRKDPAQEQTKKKYNDDIDDWVDDWSDDGGDDDWESPPIVAYLEGYSTLPSNDYKTLMNAVAKYGPVVIAAAASNWAFYESGIFESPNLELPSAWDINHGIVVEGYGADEETGEMFWLVRNSWGKSWGEGGRIRLKRVDPDDEETDDDDFCGMDLYPEDGTVCQYDDSGRPIPLAPIKVCGTNGMLFDSVIPVHAYL